MAFPRLSSNLRKKRVSKKDISKEESAERFMIGWMKCPDPVKSREQSRGNIREVVGREKLSMINVRSYRSIVG